MLDASRLVGAAATTVVCAGAVATPTHASTTPTSPWRTARSVAMRQHFAEWSLRANGIGWRSNGRCADRARPVCTSLEGIRWGSLDGLVEFGRESGCPLTVSGGTERGHAPGPYSHGTGYKIDVLPSGCADRHITRRYQRVGARGDGSALYRSPAGVVFAREPDHWDILFR
jgi:hypothetical protein